MVEMHILFIYYYILATTTCPDVTTPGGLPSVAFEKSQYFSKMSENSEIGSQVIVVNAISNTGESVRYFLDQSVT